MKNHDAMRLLAWYGLERNVDNSKSMASSAKLAGAWESFPRPADMGTAFPPDFLLASIVALSTTWSQGSPLLQTLGPSGHELPSDLRKLVAEAVTKLVR